MSQGAYAALITTCHRPRSSIIRHAACLLALCLMSAPLVANGYRGATAVLALCDVTMKSGEVVEGAVAISRALPSGAVTTDGFYVVRTRQRTGDMSQVQHLFSKTLEWYEPHTGRRQFVPGRILGEPGGVYFYRSYYLRDISGQDAPAYEGHEGIEDTDGRRVLAREKVYRSRHEMLDYVPLYADPLSALRGACRRTPFAPQAEETQIPLADIERFTVVHEPSPERLAAVRAASRVWSREPGEPEPEGDEHGGPDPVWFHNIVPARADPDDWPEYDFRTWSMTP